MIVADTNFVIRLITGDVPGQLEQALQTVERLAPQTVLLCDAVLTELCFVLEFHDQYALTHQQITDAVDTLVQSGSFELQPGANEAFRLYVAQPKLDFVDCLLAVRAEYREAALLTFDKRLIKQLR